MALTSSGTQAGRTGALALSSVTLSSPGLHLNGVSDWSLDVPHSARQGFLGHQGDQQDSVSGPNMDIWAPQQDRPLVDINSLSLRVHELEQQLAHSEAKLTECRRCNDALLVELRQTKAVSDLGPSLHAPLDSQQFPKVRYWARPHGDPWRADGALGFVNNANGYYIGDSGAAALRQHCKLIFEDLKLLSLAQTSFKKVGRRGKHLFINAIEEFCPLLTLCHDHWKAVAVGTEVYPQWVTRGGKSLKMVQKVDKQKSDPGSQANSDADSDSDSDANVTSKHARTKRKQETYKRKRQTASKDDGSDDEGEDVRPVKKTDLHIVPTRSAVDVPLKVSKSVDPIAAMRSGKYSTKIPAQAMLPPVLRPVAAPQSALPSTQQSADGVATRLAETSDSATLSSSSPTATPDSPPHQTVAPTTTEINLPPVVLPVCSRSDASSVAPGTVAATTSRFDMKSLLPKNGLPKTLRIYKTKTDPVEAAKFDVMDWYCASHSKSDVAGFFDFLMSAEGQGKFLDALAMRQSQKKS